MEDQLGHFVIRASEYVFHCLVAIVLLSEIHIKIAIIRMIGVVARTMSGVAVIIHDHGHGYGHASVGGSATIRRRNIVILWRILVVVLRLVPFSCQKR